MLGHIYQFSMVNVFNREMLKKQQQKKVLMVELIKERQVRIIESLRLEKTSKIIQSNHPPTTVFPTIPCPSVQHLHVS